jgi:hypothetical protein
MWISLRILTVSALLATSLAAFVGPTRAAPTGVPPSGVAITQITQCLPISKARDRLACYDRANPPIAASKSAISKTPTAPSKPAASKTQVKFADMLAAENLKLNAKLKTICRGC